MTTDRIARIVARAQDALDAHPDFAARVTLDFGDDGAVFVDGPARTAQLGAAAADCTITVSLDDFIAIAKGALDPGLAYLRGRIAIAGDAALAMELAQAMRSAPDDASD